MDNPGWRNRMGWLCGGVLLASVVFLPVLVRLARFAAVSELESYIPLIPLISATLIYLKIQRGLPPDPPLKRDRALALVLYGGSIGIMGLQGLLMAEGLIQIAGSVLFLPVVAYVTLIQGLFIQFIGSAAYRVARFPLLFLFLMAPIPEPVAHGMRVLLQHYSADAAYLMFKLTGTPVFRDGLNFAVPGLTLRVAEECSGIHSSLVLGITALVAGHLFLKRPWGRIMLFLVVIPLSVLRNGFRVVSLALLTTHLDRGIIDGPLHHRGGPVYFVLSLVAFFVVLVVFRWCEKRKGEPVYATP